MFVAGFVALSLNCFSQITVNSAKKVGINNTSPAYQLDVSGNFRVNDSSNNLTFTNGCFYSTSYSTLGSFSYNWDEIHAVDAYFYNYTVYNSDVNTKTDIKNLSAPKDRLAMLRPVSYKWIPNFRGDEKADAKIAKQAEVEQFGLIAQEVQQIYPEIVAEDENGKLGIRYTELIPVLIKAFQEQQAEIEGLKARIEKLESGK